MQTSMKCVGRGAGALADGKYLRVIKSIVVGSFPWGVAISEQ